MLNTQQVVAIMPLALLHWIIFQVLKLIRALNYLWIASHYLDLYMGSLTASLYNFGRCMPAFSHAACASLLISNSWSSLSSSIATSNLASWACKHWAGWLLIIFSSPSVLHFQPYVCWSWLSIRPSVGLWIQDKWCGLLSSLFTVCGVTLFWHSSTLSECWVNWPSHGPPSLSCLSGDSITSG